MHNKLHATEHTDGTDDIQDATNAQKGLATADHIQRLEALSYAVQRVIDTLAPAAIQVSDGALLFDTTSTAIGIDLPPASVGAITIPFKDIGGNAQTNNITFNAVGGDTIVDATTGQTSTVIAGDGFSGAWTSNGVDTWYLTYYSGGGAGGDVVGPGSATNDALARYDGVSGSVIKDSNVTVDDSGNISTPGTVNGRDVAADGTALDTVVANLKMRTQLACSDEETDLTTGVKLRYRQIDAATLTNLRANVNVAPTGADIQVDILKNGVSILSQYIVIEAGETSSVTSATQPVIIDDQLADDDVITVEIIQIGATIAGQGLKVGLIGTYN